MRYRYSISGGLKKIKTKTDATVTAIALALSGTILALGIAFGATAAPRTTPSVSFFYGGSGAASWSRDMSHDSDVFSMMLTVPDNDSYAGIDLHHVGTALPASAPSFEYYETGTPSGGAPRLVIASTDGCYATEYYTPGTTNAWLTAGQWDLMGSCGYHYNTGWDGVQSGFTGNVASVYIVSDAYLGAHTDWIDNVQYGGTTISQPSDNANSH